MSNVLDGYLLELYKTNRPLAKALQFVIFQLNRIDAEIQAIPPVTTGGQQNATLFLPQGINGQELPVADRSMFTHPTIGGDDAEFQLGALYFNRLASSKDVSIRGILKVTNGQKSVVTNVGAFNIILSHEDASALASLRILCGGSSDIVLIPNDSALIWRDEVSDRWRAYQL